MPCLVALIALFMPRIAIILVVVFSDFIGNAYRTTLWPFLGFLFVPLTTLAYAWAMHSNNGSVSGWYLLVVVVAVLIDLGIIGGGAKQGRRVQQ